MLLERPVLPVKALLPQITKIVKGLGEAKLIVRPVFVVYSARRMRDIRAKNNRQYRYNDRQYLIDPHVNSFVS